MTARISSHIFVGYENLLNKINSKSSKFDNKSTKKYENTYLVGLSASKHMTSFSKSQTIYVQLKNAKCIVAV